MNRTVMLADHSSILKRTEMREMDKQATEDGLYQVHSNQKRQLLYSAVAASMTGQMKFLRALERQTIRDD
jgi:hypothetical protein